MEENLPKKYRLKFLGKEEIAKNTFSFYFERPKDFVFTAGQNLRLVFPDVENGRRTFTIASAPYEKDLKVAMRIRDSEFKKKIISLEKGDFMEMEGPTGHKFSLHEDKKIPAVFIAGGIGIVPALSIISQTIHDNLKHEIFLFYSNRKKEDISFYRELKKMQEKNPNLKVIFILTKEMNNHEKFEHKRINESMIKKYTPNIKGPFYYISGPEGMVFGMNEMLKEMKINEEKIMTKKFSGY